MQSSTANIFAARQRHSGRWFSVLVMSGVVAALAGVVAYQAGHGGAGLASAVFTLFLLLSCYLAFQVTSFTNDLRLLTRRYAGWTLPFVFVAAVYLVYATGTQTLALHSIASLLAFVAVPTILVHSSRDAGRPLLVDWLAVVAIWLPFDLGLLKGVWLWPLGTGAYILNTAVAVCLAIFLFSSVRRIPDIGFRLAWGKGDLATTFGLFSVFCVTAIPFGFFTGFIEFNVRGDWFKALLSPFGIFLFIAFPEELLFRGLLQNFIQKRFGSEKIALVVASILFGATHLNNEPLMDYRYFVPATLAGLFYGIAYIRTKNLLVPSIIHALVDAVWMQFLWKTV